MRNNPRDNLLDLHRRHVKAWERRSSTELKEIYSEDAVVFSTFLPPRFSDFKTFENTLQRYFSKLRELTFFTSNIQIEVKGEIAWVTSQYLLAYGLEEKVLRENGRWTEIYQKENGAWKLTHLHSSPDPVSEITA
jgi:ketosteroid isomerase-like protein